MGSAGIANTAPRGICRPCQMEGVGNSAPPGLAPEIRQPCRSSPPCHKTLVSDSIGQATLGEITRASAGFVGSIGELADDVFRDSEGRSEWRLPQTCHASRVSDPPNLTEVRSGQRPSLITVNFLLRIVSALLDRLAAVTIPTRDYGSDHDGQDGDYRRAGAVRRCPPRLPRTLMLIKPVAARGRSGFDATPELACGVSARHGTHLIKFLVNFIHLIVCDLSPKGCMRRYDRQPTPSRRLRGLAGLPGVPILEGRSEWGRGRLCPITMETSKFL
jgi:hypothetical protein